VKKGWQIKNLGDVCKVIGGGTPSKEKSEFYSGEIPWATVRDMRTDIIIETECTITETAVASSSTNVIPGGNVVIATRVGLGKVCLLGQDTAINQDLRGIVPINSEVLIVRYLFWWLKSIADVIVSEGTGATVQGVKLPFVKSLQIPLPPPSEQHRIVAILDEAFDSIATAKANAEKNLQNTLALFESGYITIFNEAIADDFVVKTVAEIACPSKNSMRTGPFGSQLLHSEFVDEGIAVLGIDNAVSNEFRWDKRRYITQEKFKELTRYRVKPGDVLITIMGTCGRCAIVPDDIPPAINSKHLCCITLDLKKCIPTFLHGYFLYHPISQAFLASKAKGSIMAGLNMGIISELPVVLPPVKQQQQIMEKVDRLKDATQHLESVYQQKITALAELKKSLLHQAFTGQL
jgi:type I restriction enzyme, S subunit